MWKKSNVLGVRFDLSEVVVFLTAEKSRTHCEVHSACTPSTSYVHYVGVKSKYFVFSTTVHKQNSTVGSRFQSWSRFSGTSRLEYRTCIGTTTSTSTCTVDDCGHSAHRIELLVPPTKLRAHSASTRLSLASVVSIVSTCNHSEYHHDVGATFRVRFGMHYLDHPQFRNS
jgi:hypothetical protein